MSISPLAPARFPDLPPVPGVSLATFEAGLRYKGRADLMLALVVPGSSAAAVFTSSLCPSAPVDWCKSVIGNGTARVLVCNSGNANAFTGRAGEVSAARTAETIAAELGVGVTDVLLASTGVIGENLPDDRLCSALPALAKAVKPSSGAGWLDAAKAIGTTDTYPKGSFAHVDGGGVVVGIAKGSGMIAPDMATMLSFIFTDVALPADVLQAQLVGSVANSYNRITVDSDTSTSDTVALFATGQTGEPVAGDRLVSFRAALDRVNLDLAHQIVRDGEGATKFVAVTVTGASDDDSALVIARSIADSPLVKTALAAEDANWGRIVMAVGKAGEPADRDRLAIWVGPEQCAEHGVVKAGYDEARATAHLQNDEVTITVDLGIGDGTGTIWTCDLTHGYIDINAGYRS